MTDISKLATLFRSHLQITHTHTLDFEALSYYSTVFSK